MSTIKVFKKGEVLYKEGEKAQNIYFIQTGSVALSLLRNKHTIDLLVLGGNQIAGEHGLAGVAVNPHTAVAQAETRAIELPIDAMKAQIEAHTQLTKFFCRSTVDKLKLTMKEFTSLKLERDTTPCPAEQTAKIFATVYHVAKTKGESKSAGSLTVAWPLMKQYAQRMFLESPKRLETAVNIFVKLGMAKYELVKPEDDPEAAEEIGFVHFFDLAAVEQFFEFYQYYYFKGGKTELLKTDDRVIQLAQVLLDASVGEPIDKHNVTRFDYGKAVDKFKSETDLQLNNDHFTLLENKGLFVKRQSTDKGVQIQFDVKEFGQTMKNWKILKEVERWNEKGSVDPSEPPVEIKKARKAHSPECPGCKHPYVGQPKFCSECGFKLVHSAAA